MRAHSSCVYYFAFHQRKQYEEWLSEARNDAATAIEESQNAKDIAAEAEARLREATRQTELAKERVTLLEKQLQVSAMSSIFCRRRYIAVC